MQCHNEAKNFDKDMKSFVDKIDFWSKSWNMLHIDTEHGCKKCMPSFKLNMIYRAGIIWMYILAFLRQCKTFNPINFSVSMWSFIHYCEHQWGRNFVKITNRTTMTGHPNTGKNSETEVSEVKLVEISQEYSAWEAMTMADLEVER